MDTNFNYEYDKLGRLVELSINNTYKTKYNYITNGNKTTTKISKIDDNGTIYSYKYDKLGNITEIKKGNLVTNKYYYDEHSELIKDEDLVNNKTTNYSYDNYGNILSRKTYEYGTDTLIDEDIYEYGNNNWQDQLTKFNDEVITYDAIGNPLTVGNKTLTWKNGRELATYNDGTNNITYKYNIDGIRTEKVENGVVTKYRLENAKIVFEDRNGTMIYYIYKGDELLGFKYNDNIYYYHKNIFGDIIGILDTSYNEIVTYEYDSWGLITNIVDNSNINLGTINPFRYRSYYYDEETSLYYLNSRYYDANIRRFINADFTLLANNDITSSNLFQYVSNNCVNSTDYSGESVNDIFNVIADTIKSLTPFYASAAAGTTYDGPLPYADITLGIAVVGVTAAMTMYNLGNYAISNVSFDFSLPDNSSKKRNNKKSKDKKTTFPSNPDNFKPNGLVKTVYNGNGNGKIIKWSHLGFKESVFEWHEDFTYGSHYHITSISKLWPGSNKTAPHYRAGTEIPEPYASIYFGG